MGYKENNIIPDEIIPDKIIPDKIISDKIIPDKIVPDKIILKKDKYYCYIIRSTNSAYRNSTYNGSTNNLTRRLRQHNGEIVGGAKATSGKGPWIYIAIWEGFTSHKEALSCEWKIKHPTNSKKRPSQYNGVKGRIKSLNLLIGLDCWTGKSTGMGVLIDNKYNLYVKDELIKLIDCNNKKENLMIKSLDEYLIK
jgi:predicted GIY-YIG superfamily endonuclease